MEEIVWIVAGLGAFVIIWLAATGFSAWLCGWTRLGRHYRAAGPPPPLVTRFQSVKVGLANYGNCVTVGLSDEGLYLAPALPFRCGAPPLWIPWDEVTLVEPYRQLWFRFHRLHVGRPRTLTKLTFLQKTLDPVAEILATKLPAPTAAAAAE